MDSLFRMPWLQPLCHGGLGLRLLKKNAEQVGVLVVPVWWPAHHEKYHTALLEGATSRFRLLHPVISPGSGHIFNQIWRQRPELSSVSACATGTHSIVLPTI